MARFSESSSGEPNPFASKQNNRAALARKAGESVARRLDRRGDMVRVVIPFGHLLIVNGTETGVQMAVRFYDAERESRLRAPWYEDLAQHSGRRR